MKVALWAEIRRLAEMEKLSGWAIARRLHCSRHTVAAALKLEQPPSSQAVRRVSVLDPYVDRIKEFLDQAFVELRSAAGVGRSDVPQMGAAPPLPATVRRRRASGVTTEALAADAG